MTASDPQVDAYLKKVVAAASGDDHAAALAAVTMRAAHARDLVVDLAVGERVAAPAPDVLAVDADDDFLRRHGPWLVGFAREALLSADDRRRGGVHHTDPALAATVVGLAFDLFDRPFKDVVVVDPAVGGGVFLLAAADQLPGLAAEVVGRLHGCDIDPVAIAVTRAALTLWSNGTAPPEGNLVVADFLDPTIGLPRADIIVGNPPFLSQLKGSTARGEDDRRRVTERWAGVGRYVDDAATFMLAAADGLTPGGVWALIQPDSVLGASDAEPVRARLDNTAPVSRIWVDDARRFAASVDTVALIGGRDRESVSIFRGIPAEELAVVDRPSAKSWAPLLAPARGVPLVGPIAASGCLGDIADITAGFRDQFYGLRDAVVEDEEAGYRLITSGLIDPLANRWGRVRCRYDKRTWSHPGVLIDRVAAEIHEWVIARLRPKVLVASQTPTIEAIVDSEGILVPCTPVVTVEPHDPADIWRVAAVLTCPATTALLARAATGTALSANALRVSASALAEIPLPMDEQGWNEAAALAEQGDVIATGVAMQQAFGVDDPGLTDWWRSRLPVRVADERLG